MKKQKLLIISSLLLFSQVSACDQNNISTSLTQKEVSNISLVSLPTKLIYYVNEEFDISGAKLLITYQDEQQETIDVTSSMVGTIDMSTAGEKTITISYQEKQTTFTITVNEDTRSECPISFIGEREYTYDGTSKEIKFTIPEGVQYKAQYEQNEVFYSTIENAPKEIGSYALVIKTEGNDQYKPTTKWFTFSIVDNKPNAVITFSEETVFYYDGKQHSPTYVVENDLESSVEYLDPVTDDSIGFDAPIEIGKYILSVTVEATENTRLTKAYKEFSIVKKDEANKITPNINIEPGQKLKIGTVPTYTITDEDNNVITDANVNILYTSDTTGYNSNVLPTEPGDYGITITVNKDDKYNQATITTWFRILSNDAKKQCPITFEEKTELFIGDEEIKFTVPEGVSYTAHYEKNEKFYSNYGSLPTETGTYALVVTTNENDIYESTTAWIVFNLYKKQDTNKTTLKINIEPGQQLSIGSIPEYTITDEDNNLITDANVSILYTSDTTGYNSNVLPTEPGDYGITITINEDDKYNQITSTTWFRIINNQKAECPISFEGDTTFTIGENREIQIIVPEGISYTAHYEKDEKFYSNYGSLPTEKGVYSLIVDTNETQLYKATHKWVIINIQPA